MRDSCTGAVLACLGDDRGLRGSPGLLREGCYSRQTSSPSLSVAQQQPRTSRAEVTPVAPLLPQVEDGWPAVPILFAKRCVDPAVLKAEGALRLLMTRGAASGPCGCVKGEGSLV